MPKIILNTVSEVGKAAQEILKRAGSNKILAFYGDLGAGKTTIIQAICRLLQAEFIAVSPTFSLINEYPLPNGEKIFHFDFYRINELEEIYDFGYEEYFYSNNYCFIEWPEKIEPLLPENALKVKIAITSKEGREIELGQAWEEG